MEALKKTLIDTFPNGEQLFDDFIKTCDATEINNYINQMLAQLMKIDDVEGFGKLSDGLPKLFNLMQLLGDIRADMQFNKIDKKLDLIINHILYSPPDNWKTGEKAVETKEHFEEVVLPKKRHRSERLKNKANKRAKK